MFRVIRSELCAIFTVWDSEKFIIIANYPFGLFSPGRVHSVEVKSKEMKQMKTRTMLGLAVLWGAVALAVDMPAGYTHLGWIESDAAGLQWINSGYLPTSSTVIRASILARVRRITWGSFFGVMQDVRRETSTSPPTTSDPP